MRKILQLIILILFLQSCGYTPIYSKLNTNNINIDVISIQGNMDINNILTREMSRYKNLSSEKNFNVKIISRYKKDSVTKDAAGDATNYRLTLEVDFMVDINSANKTFKFIEQLDMKKKDTIFEEEKYEKFIKQDMVDLIVQNFISQIIEVK